MTKTNWRSMGVFLVLAVPALGPLTVLAQSTGAPLPAVVAPSPPPEALQPFATVNGKTITQLDFHNMYAGYLRQKFYHGQVPQDKLLEARKDVTDQLINRVLLQEEIERRGIQPDAAEVETLVQNYERRYSTSPNWVQNREAMLPGLRELLSQQNRQSRLEAAVRDVPAPNDDEVQAFYRSKPELFTEPEKLRLHSILLKVDPGAPRAAWEGAKQEAESIVRRIKGGADFAAQARLSSNDASAEQGGDMGYIHVGMLPENLQSKVDSFKLGEVTDPVETLQGYAIFRLDERLPAKLQPYERVSSRAKDLLHRERKEQAWTAFLAGLRAAAKVTLHDPHSPAKAN